MAEGRERAEWNRLSELMCMVRNSNLWSKADAIKPSDINPFMREERQVEQEDSFARAKDLARRGGHLAGD